MRFLWLIVTTPLLFAGNMLPKNGLDHPPASWQTALAQAQRTGADQFRIDDMLFRTQRVQAKGFTAATWPNNHLRFYFDSQVAQSYRVWFQDALDELTQLTQLTFSIISAEEREAVPGYIHVIDGPGNFSELGYLGGHQLLSITSWNRRYVIIHEIMHALGFVHEHNRPDRDDYVVINWHNIRPGLEAQFVKTETDSRTPYDFKSIMHYSNQAFTIGGFTIEPIAEYEDQLWEMGQRFDLSRLDVRDLTLHFGAQPVHFPDPVLRSLLVARYDQDGSGDLDTYETSFIEDVTTGNEGTVTSLEGLQHIRGLDFVNAAGEAVRHVPEGWRHALTLLDVRGNPLTLDACYPLMIMDTNQRTILYDGGTEAGLLNCYGQDPYPADLFEPLLYPAFVAQFDRNADGMINPVEAQLAVTYNNDSRWPELRIPSFKGMALFPNLNNLQLGGAGLTELPDLSQWPKLWQLELSLNELSDLPGIEHLKKLAILNITGNKFTALPDLSGLDSLIVLDATANRIAEMPALPTSVQQLFFSQNKLTDIPALELPLLRVFQVAENELLTIPDMNGSRNMDFFLTAQNPLGKDSCPLIADTWYNSYSVTTQPYTGEGFNCTGSTWFTGLNRFQGTFTLRMVSETADVTGADIILKMYGADGMLTEDTVRMVPQGSLTIELTGNAIHSVEVVSPLDLSTIMHFLGDAGERFALQGRPFEAENSFVPHIARDIRNFRTRLHVTPTDDAGTTMTLSTSQVDPTATDAADHHLTRDLVAGENLMIDMYGGLGPYVTNNATFPEITAGPHQGMVTYQRRTNERVAALPFSRKNWISETLYLPYLARDEAQFTGISLANPNHEHAFVQLTAFDEGGALPDAYVIVPPHTNIVRQARDFFPNLPPARHPGWILLESSKPIATMMLYGYHETQAMAAAQAASLGTVGKELVFPLLAQDVPQTLALVNFRQVRLFVTAEAYSDDGLLLGSRDHMIPIRSNLSLPARGDNGWVRPGDVAGQEVAYLRLSTSEDFAGIGLVGDQHGLSAFNVPAPRKVE